MGTVTTRMISGKPLRDALLAQVMAVVVSLPQPPKVIIVQVGDNAASSAYIKSKVVACAKVGIDAEVVNLPAAAGERMLHSAVRALAGSPEVNAIIVQTPLPDGWQVQKALDLVPPAKDIDGLSTIGAAWRREGRAEALLPATPVGVMRLLQALRTDVKGLRVAMVGKGMVVGAPLSEMLRAAGAEVTLIDKGTLQSAQKARACDVVIAAAGVPGLVTEEWVKPAATLIDVGLTRFDGQLLGDVARVRVEGLAGALTTVPGGVGPMTVASLMTNICDATCLQLGRSRTAWEIDAELYA